MRFFCKKNLDGPYDVSEVPYQLQLYHETSVFIFQESLDEVCVKDTLDGDNMYTCSKCTKKVRAEKRACFKKLPKILCFNTMRYTFNMVAMLKEKINTLFSFPQQLNMADYMESNLLMVSDPYLRFYLMT